MMTLSKLYVVLIRIAAFAALAFSCYVLIFAVPSSGFQRAVDISIVVIAIWALGAVDD
jgi:hypothetical protein